MKAVFVLEDTMFALQQIAQSFDRQRIDSADSKHGTAGDERRTRASRASRLSVRNPI